MRTRTHRGRIPQTVRRALLALAVAAATLGFSLGVASPAQAASFSICSATAVPAGYVVTRAQVDPGTCGPHLHYWITNELYNGMHICSATRVPEGWVVTRAQTEPLNCGPHLSYWITRLA